MNADSWQEIFFTIRKNKLRTALTAFGVFWGILLLILLLGAGTGLQRGAEAGFSSDVRNAIWVGGRRTAVPYKGLSAPRQIQLTMDDVDAIYNELPGVEFVSAESAMGSFRQGDIYVTYKNRSGSFGVFGTARNYFKIKIQQDYEKGRRLNDFDIGENRKVVVIGTRVAETLFDKNADPVGEYINIGGVPFRVVGVFYDAGWEGRMSERIYMPMSTFQKTFGNGRNIGIIALNPKPGVDGYQLEEDAVALLKRRHIVSPTDKKAFYSWNLLQQAEQLTALFGAITMFVWFVGIGTLAAGIVGISNIMIITVKDRTKELGIRKALGATPGSIVSMIMTESIFITSIAGYLGLVVGVLIIEGVNHLLVRLNLELSYFKSPEVDFGAAIAAIVILILVGALAGLAPAIRAARITPVAAMNED